MTNELYLQQSDGSVIRFKGFEAAPATISLAEAEEKKTKCYSICNP